MFDDPEAEAVRSRTRGKQSFFMTGPGGICRLSLFPGDRWRVDWTSLDERNRGQFEHTSQKTAIRRALNFGCPHLEEEPDVDDERMERIWELTKKQARTVVPKNQILRD